VKCITHTDISKRHVYFEAPVRMWLGSVFKSPEVQISRYSDISFRLFLAQ